MSEVSRSPSAGGRSESSGAEGEDGAESAHQLVDHSPPPPDSPVVHLEEKASGRHRGWFIGVYLSVLITIILASILGSAFLPAQAWSQMKPEVAEVRFWVFQLGGVMGGYLFAEKRLK